MLYCSPDTPRHAPIVTDQHKDAGGWIGRWGMPKTLPQWLSEEDLEYYIGEFNRTGFRGGVNYYRNFDRNYELMENVDPVVKIPALFVVGDQDPVIVGMDRQQLEKRMRPVVPHLRRIEWLGEYSGPRLPPIPVEGCHPFRLKAATHSGEGCHP